MILVYLYVDPGSGSYLIQLIIAGILGALIYVKNIWFHIKTFFKGHKESKSSKPTDGND